ncbi:hypothetical protein [Nostoc sp. NZL]|uniref:hypothetical protein n=1 Tax=Nostoc sp. NZL TaxID=2650612 RepID=UPI0018C7BEA8|nr:hypothetical protein [Nostoc sp. NZL]MBG1244714.1 hypothetical protein [Nostoc sp. NZL]
MNTWLIASIIYISIAVITFIPTLKAIIKKVKLYPGGASFDESSYFSEEAKKSLIQHYSRLQGTLLFWKNEASKYTRFHFYCLWWTIPSATLIPTVTQLIDGTPYSKLFLTIVSTHTAMLLSFYKGFKIESNLKAFRHGESEFYDLYRRLLDRPLSFGDTEAKQLESYFYEVELIRKYVRNAETDNFPFLSEEVRLSLENKKSGSGSN